MNAYPPAYFVEHCEKQRWEVCDPAIITYETASGEIESVLGTMILNADDDFTMIYVAPQQSAIPTTDGKGDLLFEDYIPEKSVRLLQVRHAAVKEIAQVFAREYFEDDDVE